MPFNSTSGILGPLREHFNNYGITCCESAFTNLSHRDQALWVYVVLVCTCLTSVRVGRPARCTRLSLLDMAINVGSRLCSKVPLCMRSWQHLLVISLRVLEELEVIESLDRSCAIEKHSKVYTQARYPHDDIRSM